MIGDFSTPLSQNSISKQLYLSSLEFNDKVAVISNYQDIQLTYDELFKLARRAAANMIDLGFQPGTKVGIYSPNNAEWILCQYACSLANLHMVNINPAYKPQELIHGLKLTEVESLIVSDNELPARILNNVDNFMLSGQASIRTNQDTGAFFVF